MRSYDAIQSRQKAIPGFSDWFLLPLKAGEGVALPGITQLRVLRGSVTINGAKVVPSEAVHRIQYPEHIGSTPMMVATTDPSTMAVDDSEINLFDQPDTEFLSGSVFPDYPVVAAVSPKLHQHPSLNLLNISNEWEQCANAFIRSLDQPVPPVASDPFISPQPARIMVTGPKGSGKSTFCRYLANRIITRKPHSSVLFLDADPGQPELSLPGTVTLTRISEPIFSLPHVSAALAFSREEIASVFFGHASPANDPAGFVQAVQRCLECLEEGSVPMIINCHGWMTGIGELTIGAILATAKPTFFVSLDKLGASNDLVPIKGNPLVSDETLFEINKISIPIGTPTVLDDSSTKSYTLSPADHRWLRFASYFKPSLADATSWLGGRPRDFFEKTGTVVSISRSHATVSFLDGINLKTVADGADEGYRIEGAKTGVDSVLCSREWLAEALVGTLVGFESQKNSLCIGLGLVLAVLPESIEIILPEHVSLKAQEIRILRGSVNWNPRESQRFGAGGDRPEKFYLAALGGLDGARNQKSRSGLGRKRLAPEGK